MPLPLFKEEFDEGMATKTEKHGGRFGAMGIPRNSTTTTSNPSKMLISGVCIIISQL